MVPLKIDLDAACQTEFEKLFEVLMFNLAQQEAHIEDSGEPLLDARAELLKRVRHMLYAREIAEEVVTTINSQRTRQ